MTYAAAARVVQVAFRGSRTSGALGTGSTRGLAGYGARFDVDEQRFHADMRRLDRTQLHRARVRALVRLAVGFRREARAEIHRLGAIDRGRLAQGLGEVVDQYRYEARMISKAAHTRPVLDGRRAGAPMPPLKPLARWVRRKGLHARDGGPKSGKRAMRNVRSIAFLVARAISRRGIPPKDFVTTPYRNMLVKAPRVLHKEMRLAAKGVVK
ncbi:MAG TPA: hypothetical protein VFH78_15675 [Candidatus Thermoplasmatota archaeon]|nr:hypothetical protein [Candidatus Thermoplasmatota archaeon]